MHQPVMVAEVLDQLAPVDGGTYVDGNLGLGGHSAGILERCKPTGVLIAFEWDASALALARERLASFGNRVITVHRNFATLKETLAEMEIPAVDGILLDLGLSSLQLDTGERGFSFKGCEPLDMRMDQRKEQTAADLLNGATQEELADIFYYYGEERQARRIAQMLVEERRRSSIKTTDQLVKIVAAAIPKRFHPRKIHVATKVFQALRIAVNGELDNLRKILADGPGLLKEGGRFGVISFHSLEDRLVKRCFQNDSRLQVLTRKPIRPSDQEVQQNFRSRSAKLRVAEARGESVLQ